jgi:predicted nucleic acid-binding protein
VAARVSSAFKGKALVVDNSAFQRGGNEIVRADWLQALEEGNLYRSPILEFEVLYSARNAREHAELRDELEALRPLELSETVVGAALEAQAELARHAAGFHRLPHQDYLVQRSPPPTNSGYCTMTPTSIASPSNPRSPSKASGSPLPER